MSFIKHINTRSSSKRSIITRSRQTNNSGREREQIKTRAQKNNTVPSLPLPKINSISIKTIINKKRKDNPSSSSSSSETNKKQKKIVVNPEETKSPFIEIDSLKVGEYLSRTQFLKVTHINKENSTIRVQELRTSGLEGEFTINATSLQIASSQQIKETVTLNKTELISQFLKCYKDVFTVCFHCVIKPKEIVEQLEDQLKYFQSKKKKKLTDEQIETITQEMKTSLEGKQRILVGRMLNTNFGVSKLGYALVDDLEQQDGIPNLISARKEQPKLVNLREIKWFIYHGIKYKLASSF